MPNDKPVTTNPKHERLMEMLKEIGGCSNGGCFVVRPKGTHTNGLCHCLESPLTAKRVVNAYKCYVRADVGSELMP